MSVSGSAKVTYFNGDGSEVTGNPFGMNTSLGFTGSGDVNGYETTLFITAADQFGGMSSASLAVDLGDLGKLTFDHGRTLIYLSHLSLQLKMQMTFHRIGQLLL